MRFIAFYLPQYHPIPENDAWWGNGFTDWVNVRKTRSRYPGHWQPHEPSELGYYDLRDPLVRQAQADLAKAHGLDAFCYYHYWFNGRRLLGEPLDQVLLSGRPEFPFCLCWANENWTRAWDGKVKDILISQKYSSKDDRAHWDWLLPVFKDSRYLKVDGKPLFLVYRPDAIPEIETMLGMWRAHARDAGLPGIFLCAVRSNFPLDKEARLIASGFDALVDFQPNMRDWPPESLWSWAGRGIGRRLERAGKALGLLDRSREVPRQRVVPYSKVVEQVIGKPQPSSYRRFPCVFPSWDNSPRRVLSNIIQNESPELFRKWLTESAQRVSGAPEDEQIVFINAWNEWAEGCHLEPDRKMGRAFLEAVRNVKASLASEEAADQPRKGNLC